MKLLELFMYAIVIIFIVVVVSMTGSKVLYREQHDLGIYKSLGFSSAKLRFTFSIRFGAVSLVGSILGVILNAVITDPITTALLKTCGISTFSSSLNPLQMITPASIVVLFLLCLHTLPQVK